MRYFPIYIIATVFFYTSCSDDAAPTDPGPSPGQSNGEWVSKAPLASPRQEMPIAVLDGKIYVPGGIRGSQTVAFEVEVYDPASNTWSTTNSLPQPRHHFAMAAATNGKLYVIGGYPNSCTGVNSVFEYDPATDAWATRTSMPTARGAHVAVTYQDKIYAIGGRFNGPALGTLEIYDPATDSWAADLPGMPTPREHLAAAAIDSLIYVIGGRFVGDGGFQNVATLEALNPRTLIWTQLPNMPTARGGLAAAGMNGRLYVFGGEIPGVFAENEEFNPATNSWRTVEPLPTARHGMGAVTFDNMIYVIGGATIAGFGVTGVNEVFSISLE